MTTRVCLLTGASGALGAAFIARCAADYRIVAVHHRTPVHFATADQRFVDPLAPSAPVAANAHAVHAIAADLRVAADVDRMVVEIAERFGRVDLVVNAAAIRAWSGLLTAGAIESAEQVFRTNVIAPLRVCLTIARRFWEADPAANERANRNIVNVSSSAGLFVYPDLGQAAYAASKAALNHLTFHLASELWQLGVRVNAVAPDSFPGRVRTDAVLDAIVALDRGTETGQLVQLLGGDD